MRPPLLCTGYSIVMGGLQLNDALLVEVNAAEKEIR